jgi:hypothetical protein
MNDELRRIYDSLAEEASRGHQQHFYYCVQVCARVRDKTNDIVSSRPISQEVLACLFGPAILVCSSRFKRTCIGGIKLCTFHQETHSGICCLHEAARTCAFSASPSPSCSNIKKDVLLKRNL